MTTRKSRGYFHAVLVGVLLCNSSGLISVSDAQVTSSGLGTVVTPSAGTFDITGGTRPGGGTNLFHSFGNFSLNTGESANFLNTPARPATTNILSRVTGGNPSSIFGTINTLDFPGANLFLMNPAGIIFGPTAQLNVSGSFHATTSDYIKLGNDGIFYADTARESVLTAAPPSAFGFLNTNPAPIEVQTGGIDFTTFLPAALLQVPEGQTLSLVGGTTAGSEIPGVSIGALDGSSPGYLLAPAGRVNLVSVASAGEAKFDGTGFNVDGFAQLGGIKVGPGSLVDAKEIFIRSGRLVIDDGVLLPGAFASELSFVGLSPLPDGGEVNIKVTNDVTITGTPFANEPLTFAPPGIFVYTGDPLGNSISPAAKVPDIKIDAGAVSISGFAGIQVQRNAPGDTGNVVINANQVTVGNGGSIVLVNKYQGNGPSLSINAKTVDVSGNGSDSPFGFEGIAVQGLSNFAYPFLSNDPSLITGDSGKITINASDNLSVRGVGQITTDSRNFGRAGDITINAGNVLVAGTGDAQSALIGSQSAFTGDSGSISINATGAITAKDGARITSASLGAGNAGNVTLTAGGAITLSGADARIVGATFQPPDSQLNDLFNQVFFESFDDMRTQMGNPQATLMDVLAWVNDPTNGKVSTPIPGLDPNPTPGSAGTVAIATPLLTLNAGTRIETSTGWEGNAGSVVGNVGSLFVNDGGAVRSRSGVEFLDGTASVGPGDGGSVTFTATDTIGISGKGSSISTTTFGDGNAGNIVLTANQITIQNSGSVTSETGGTLNGQFFAGTGNAGQITASTPTLTMANGGIISVTTSGAGKAGNVELNVTNLTQTGGSRVDSSTSGGGSGGDLTVTAANLASLSGARTGLFSTASSTGAGGDINVNAPQVQILAGATMSADSTGTATATAGNVNIVTSDLNMQNSSITTGATLADGGNISITTTGSIVQLTNSQITTSVQSGVGGGGNITIDSDLVVLNDSQILANAFGGPGGNINITTDVFLVNSGGTLPTSLAGIVDASSALSTPGVINIEAAFTDVAGEVAQLPEAPLQATELLRASCAARFAGGKASSLVLGGRDGVPIQPGGLLPSPLYLPTDAGNPATGVKTSANDLPARFSLLGSVGLKSRTVTQYSLLPNAKCAF